MPIVENLYSNWIISLSKIHNSSEKKSSLSYYMLYKSLQFVLKFVMKTWVLIQMVYIWQAVKFGWTIVKICLWNSALLHSRVWELNYVNCLWICSFMVVSFKAFCCQTFVWDRIITFVYIYCLTCDCKMNCDYYWSQWLSWVLKSICIMPLSIS